MPSRGKYLRGKYSSRASLRRKRLRAAEKLAYYAGTCLVIAAAVFILRGFSSGGKRVGIPAKDVAAFRIPLDALGQLREASGGMGADFAQAVCLYSIENGFFPEKAEAPPGVEPFMRDYESIKQGYREKDLAPYYGMMGALLGEIERFPVPGGFDGGYMFGDSWGAKAGGADIIDRENIGGRLPVVSMTAGVVTEAGWGEKTGFRVVVKTPGETSLSYSSLASLADGLGQGSAVRPGDPLGQMGHIGTASVRLHLEISPRFAPGGKGFQINPYPFLRLVEGEGEDMM